MVDLVQSTQVCPLKGREKSHCKSSHSWGEGENVYPFSGFDGNETVVGAFFLKDNGMRPSALTFRLMGVDQDR